MIEAFGGVVTTPGNTRQDFLNVPVPLNEDWRIVEIRFFQHIKYDCIAEVHFNRDYRHTIWASHHSQPFTLDDTITGGTYITVIINNRQANALAGFFLIVVERGKAI